ncbi:MAG: hypothetical protein K2L34_01565 [Muribaculaceae bacterium]|nr:hypothetical protein [Muribaculaceae bacterium]
MLLFDIYDYDDFKSVFGLETHGNGVKSRKNKILLRHIKNPALIRWCREHNDWTLLHVRNMADLKRTVLEQIRVSGKEDRDLPNKVVLMGKTYWSGQYRTDHMDGLCEDYDKKAVRYVNTKTERVYKMKAGKFITAIIRETEIGRILSEQVVNWLSEEFAQDWQIFTYGQTPEVELHVDDNFELIYDSEACKDFNGCSCMTGRGRHGFYENSVDVKAAYLLDPDGYVLARAILFTDVKDQDGKKWRLLERQYSKESNEVLKRLLVDLLIRGDYIDGYKQIGAGCSESRAFVANDGSSLSEMKFSIRCELETYDVLSYQDSFKYYDYDHSIAYNYWDAPHSYNLDTTDYNLQGDCEDADLAYDDYHDYECEEVQTCYYHGQEIEVDVDNLEDFIYVESEGEYHHISDVTQCDQCGRWIVKEVATYNSEAEAYFCNSVCEAQYVKERFSEFDDAFFPCKDDITFISSWDEESQTYNQITISRESRENLINSGNAFGYGDSWFIKSDSALKTA